MDTNNVYDQSGMFKFNLVPPKTKAELVVLEERDNSILSSFLLVFFAMFIYFILNLIQTFVLNQRIDSTNTQIATQEASFANYDEIKRVNGELITKGELLEPVLKKDIKLTQLLDLGQQIVNDNPSVSINTYSRETTGEFVLTFRMPDIQTASKLATYLNANTKVSNVFVRSVEASNGGANSTISFVLLNS